MGKVPCGQGPGTTSLRPPLARRAVPDDYGGSARPDAFGRRRTYPASRLDGERQGVTPDRSHVR
jgi:hypothetical protein